MCSMQATENRKAFDRRSEFAKSNPWSVTEGEARVLDATLKSGCIKVAAHSLGLGVSDVYSRVKDVRTKMKVRGGVHYLVLWALYRDRSSTRQGSLVLNRVANDMPSPAPWE